MNDMLQKLLTISEASEASCQKALRIAKGDFIKAIQLAIQFDNEFEQQQQTKHIQQTQITQLARDLELEIEICAKFLNNINFDTERARKLFQLNDHMRKSTRLSPIDFAQLLETHQYHIQSVEKAIKALQPKRTINLCGEYLDKKSIEKINPNQAFFNDDTEWADELEDINPSALGFLYIGESAQCQKEDLRGIDFTQIDSLYEVDFTGSDLSGCSFQNTVLENVCFDQCTLTNTNFIGAEITECTFNSTSLSDIVFSSRTRFYIEEVFLESITFFQDGTRSEFDNGPSTGKWNFTSSGYLGPKSRVSVTLTSQNLPDLDLTQANITKSTFQKTTLIRVLLSQGRCCDVDFSKSDLTEANFSMANCDNANFTETQLTKALFTSASCNNVNFTQTNLHQANLVNANCHNADFTHTILTKADLRGATFTGSTFNQANLTGSLYDMSTVWPSNVDTSTLSAINIQQDLKYQDLSGYNLEGYDFSGRDLEGVNFTDANLTKTSFNKCNLTNVTFFNANLFDASLEQADISNADLRETNLTWTRFSKTLMNDQTQWPPTQNTTHMEQRGKVIKK